MGLRAEYSLGHSEFNEFLFAFVGEEKSGSYLTVLSALARLGIDPWEEASRLSRLSEESATTSLTVTIAGLPEGNWKASDSRSIAARLLSFLPRRHATSERSQDGGTGGGQASKPAGSSWIIWLALVATLIAMFWQSGS